MQWVESKICASKNIIVPLRVFFKGCSNNCFLNELVLFV